MALDVDVIEQFFGRELEQDSAIHAFLQSISAEAWEQFRALAWTRLEWEKQRRGIINTEEAGAYVGPAGQTPAEVADAVVLGRKERLLWLEEGRRVDQ
jgi:hypothetical protein